MSRFIIKRQPMLCGSAEAEAREYNLAIDRNNKVVWLYALTDADPGGHVYCHDTTDTRSDGFAGRTLTFKIGKTGQYSAKGPWHSNSDALFDRTGVDLRDKHLTFAVIAKRRVYDGSYRDILDEILYMDKEPQLGLFERGSLLAKKMATELGHPVVCYSESSGGSSNGYEYPEGTEPKDWYAWIKENGVLHEEAVSGN